MAPRAPGSARGVSRGRRTGCALVGRAIRLAREDRHWSQAWLADEVKLTRGAIAQYETGHRGVPLTTLAVIATALNVEFRGVRYRWSRHHIEQTAWAAEPVTVSRLALPVDRRVTPELDERGQEVSPETGPQASGGALNPQGGRSAAATSRPTSNG